MNSNLEKTRNRIQHIGKVITIISMIAMFITILSAIVHAVIIAVIYIDDKYVNYIYEFYSDNALYRRTIGIFYISRN